MKSLLVFLTVLFACSLVASADSSRDVLAYSSGEWAWYAHVTKTTTPIPNETPVSGEQTDFFIRHNGPGEQWHALPSLSGRAIALASRMSQLAVLMNDGQWQTLWSDSSATGQALPAGGRMKTIADDGENVWSIGSVNGGLAIANERIHADPASTEPTTAAAASSPTQPSAAVLPARLVLFRQIAGRWETVAEFPSDQTPDSEDDLSLTVKNGIPLVSFKNTGGGVCTLTYSAENSWQIAATIKPATTGAISSFRIISDGVNPILWTAAEHTPGELYPDALSGNHATTPVTLQWPGAISIEGTPAVTFSGGYVCVFAAHAGKVFEQRYTNTGKPFSTPAELLVPDTDVGLVPHWLEVVLLAFMGFSIGARVFRQWAAGESATPAELPAPAPLLLRFSAGLIDALPVMAAAAWVLTHADLTQGIAGLPPVKTMVILSIAVAVYLLHTTLVEVFTGRSAGKWLLGLKVVTLDGKPPTQMQFLMRNLLRIVDPLVMILFSPLRQRDADTVANTMVVATNSRAVESSGISGSGVDKTE